MATSNCRFPIMLKPGRVLGFFVMAAVICGVALLYVQKPPAPVERSPIGASSSFASQDPGNPPPKLQLKKKDWVEKFQIDPTQRVTFFAAWAAFVATLIAAYIGVQNVVRHHTVNTLLQARLSEEFMRHGKGINKGVAKYNKDAYPKNRKDRYIDEGDLVYMLNFYEYIAVGIKHGDMSESVMKDTVRGIVISMYRDYEWFIKEAQSESPLSSTVFENLVDLAKRWEKERYEEIELEKRRIDLRESSGLPAHESRKYKNKYISK